MERSSATPDAKQPLRASFLENSPRRKRQLPEPAAGCGMRRAQSLSFLPGSGAQGSRRRLPDPGQGRLIQHIAAKLKEESLVRLKVAKELKEEKRLRWRTEDELVATQKEVARLTHLLNAKTEEASALSRDLAEARRLHDTTADRLAEMEKQQHAINAQRQRLAADQRHHQEQEAALEQAYEELDAERRETARLRCKYDALISAIDDFQPGASKVLLEKVAEQEVSQAKARTFSAVDI
ncbi:hypothetical protein PTSG_09786 [Salpingoeca rosetta]|uniref:Uncharacterized protein n=1 Tax=Salpingoeca rosetta (strain ATCC 50818 / BSB-021) TaxID=946362 RepID=F2UP21_SALR5|nr:uncharacterized protein PTSG_09786 [Salpingoeca rosetta]EGD79376.1 hypothetical protein PTSG_09786 [Salpingoeca rosetta]|eukprot:XP_004989145.1 hypothetical protein PTSG_09786 [Salpingoeca rosetta]